MSLSLVSESLELLDSDIGLDKSTTVSKTTQLTGKKKANKNKSTGKQKSIFHGKKVTCVIDEYKKVHKEQAKDRTKKALKMIKKIDSACSASKYVKQARRLHEKQLEQRHAPPQSKKKDENQGSVFTDADFARVRPRGRPRF